MSNFKAKSDLAWRSLVKSAARLVRHVLVMSCGALLLASCTTISRPSMTGDRDIYLNGSLDSVARTHPVTFLDRLGWGADAAQLAALQSVGANAYLDSQLHPRSDPELPQEIADQLVRLEIDKPLESLIPQLLQAEQALRDAKRNDQVINAPQQEADQKAINQRRNELTQQAIARQLLLAVYSPNQLQERVTWFWMNHFNVFRAGNVGPMMGDYYARIIKPHALGHFRDLLQSTAFSPQMLVYLNNAQNTRDHINENYARELLELHTLGVGNGYTQTDVTSLAGLLTGLGVNLADRPLQVRPALRAELWQQGLVVFNPGQHNPDSKVVLGRTFRGAGRDEIKQLLDMLARMPATARHVCGQLAQYLVNNDPPQPLVDAMVRTWADTDGDIAAVLRTLFSSAQFAESLAQPQFKDPMRYVLSAIRASLDGRIIVNTRPMIGMLDRLGEPLYGRQTPDGYPMATSAWDGPGQITARFEVARQIGTGAPMLFVHAQPELAAGMIEGPVRPSDTSQHPAPRVEPPVLADSAVFMACEARLSTSTRQALARSDNRVLWNAIWLSSPEFMND
jgi:uncharacterized protein (DUF1800 family)